MTYLEWCQLTFDKVADQIVNGDNATRNYGIQGVDFGSEVEGDQRVNEAFSQAIDDLSAIGILRTTQLRGITLGDAGFRLVDSDTTALTTVWPAMFRDFHLPSHHRELLAAAVPLSERSISGLALMESITFAQLLTSTGRTPTPGDAPGFYNATDGVFTKGILTSGGLSFRPTYAGVVIATQRERSELESLIRKLESKWETPGVDFKRELSLRTVDQRAELVKDIIALATTQLDGERYYLIGWDPTSRLFTPPGADPKLSEEQMQQILGAYCDPPPHLRYEPIRWRGGLAGVITVTRNAAVVPYRVSKAIGRLKRGDTFVRHGTVTEPPTPAELAALEAEATRARHQS